MKNTIITIVLVALVMVTGGMTVAAGLAMKDLNESVERLEKETEERIIEQQELREEKAIESLMTGDVEVVETTKVNFYDLTDSDDEPYVSDEYKAELEYNSVKNIW